MKQKLVSILLVLCMVVALVPAIVFTSAAANTVEDTNKDGTLPEGAEVLTGTATAFSGGNGTAENPYQIKDVTEFRYLQDLLFGATSADYLDKSYVLTGNIYLNKNFTDYLDVDGMPVADYQGSGLNKYSRAKGNKQVSILPGDFTGTFDGGNFGLYNLFARFSDAGGLFENLQGIVRNLNLYGGYMWQVNGGSFGTIASSLSGGTIENCYSSVYICTAAGTTSGVGGLVGITNTDATIKNSTYAGAVNATSTSATTGQIGGIVARVASGTLSVRDCVNRGKIVSKAGASRIGGIVAFFNGATLTIENCINYGAVVTASTVAEGSGGIVGLLNAGTLTATQCANYGAISDEGKNNVGGITGYAKTSATYGKCANYAGVTATTAKAGGITGDSRNGVFTDCANYGDITGGQIAGIAGGYVSVSTPYSGLYSDGAIAHADGATGDMSILMAQCNANATVVSNSVGVGTLYLFGQAYSNKPKSETNTKTYAAGELNIEEAVGILNTGSSTSVWVAGETAPVLKWIADMNATPAPEITIDGASLTIGGNVTMNLFVKKTTVAAAGVTLGKISIVDNDNTPYEVTDDSGDYYVFTIKGLHASEFGKNKIYHVQYTTADAPGTPIDCTATKEYSPLQYAINMYNADDKTETVTDLDKLLLSIVNYADAAAKTTDASTAFKAVHTTKAGFSTLPTFEAIIAEDTGVYTYDKLKTEKNLPSISANLTETIALTLTFDGSDLYQTGNDNMMMIGNAEIPGKVNTLSVVFSELFATDLYNTITLTFKETLDSDSGLTVTATTSLVQFLKSYQGTAEEALVAATAQYLYVARLFCLNNQPNA